MGTKLLTEPMTWPVFEDNDVDSHVALRNEAFLDIRDGVVVMRIGDGVTPGGRLAYNNPMGQLMKPFIISPTNGANLIFLDAEVVSSDIQGLNSDGTNATHGGTYWEISIVSDFSTTIYQSGLDEVNLKRLPLKDIDLEHSTQYYIRIMYASTSVNRSVWSEIFSFTTRMSYPSLETNLLTLSGAETQANFGNTIIASNDGKTVIISAVYGSQRAVRSGECYIYKFIDGNWINTQKIVPSDAQSYMTFSETLNISADGKYVIVGARGYWGVEGTLTGRAYVYHMNDTGQYVDEHIFHEPNGIASNPVQYGYGVALSADATYAFIGSHGDSSNGTTKNGAMFVYKRIGSTWSFLSKLFSPVPANGENFGLLNYVTLDSNTLAIESRYADPQGTNSGACHIYRRVGDVFSHHQTLVNPGGQAETYAGSGMDMSYNGKMIAFPGHLAGDLSVYMFILNAATDLYEYVQKITRLDIDLASGFGYRCCFKRNGYDLVINASFDGSSGPDNSGLAFLYTYNSATTLWEETYTYSANVKSANDYLGTGLAFVNEDNDLMMGANGYDADDVAETGAVYVFK